MWRGGVIKGCNFFFGSKIGKCSMWVGALPCNKKKISRAERSWTNPLNALQEAIHYSFIKYCILCFSLWYEFFEHYALRVRKNYQHGLDTGPSKFQFLRPRGCLTKPFRSLSLCFRVTGKTPVLISYNNFVKKIFVCIHHHDNVLARCDSIFPLLRYQGVWNKTCTQLSLPKSSFRIQRTTVLGMFKDSAVILVAIWWSFCTKSVTAAMFISVQVDFGQPPLSSSSTSSLPSRNREYHLKMFDRFRSSFPQAFAPVLVSLSQMDQL